jgi:putative ABC transport system permease protein
MFQGRDFDSQDTNEKANVVVVDTALVDRFFPRRNPIGETIRIGGSGGNYDAAETPQYTIVGVVPHLCHDTPGEWQVPFQAYRPATQANPLEEFLVIRSNLDPATLAAGIREAVASIDSAVPIFDVHTYNEVIAQRYVVRRLSTVLAILFSGAALFLSGVGLYGVVSYFVGQKTREIGIRIALGAQARNILKLVAEQGLWPVTIGLAIGIVAGLLSARFIEAFLYGVSAFDPITMGLTVLVLGIASLAACLLPAVKAIRINPTKVLNE